MPVRTRFAPSPTGSLHVGGARTALYCLLHARKEGGTFILRIEDTDRARSSDEAAAGILRDLTWLGLDWDEGPGKDGGHGPYFQSERLPLYEAAFAQLRAEGRAYDAWDTADELSAARAAAQAAKQNYRYRRQPVSPDDEARFRAEGRTPVLRFAAPDHPIDFDDTILGSHHTAAEDLDDLVIRKADGFPTYHFAVVVDDHHMGVDLVLRGQEHLMNTPKHLATYEALGWTPPAHGHMPLIFNADGSKMSKRDKAKAARAAARSADFDALVTATGLSPDDLSAFLKKKTDDLAIATAIADALQVELPMIEVMDFRRGGFLPEAILNYLALLGWSPGDDREFFTLPELIDAFDLARVGNTPARFDLDKLRWLNSEHLRALSVDALLPHHDAYLEVVPSSPFATAPPDLRRGLLALYQARIHSFADLDAQAAFFFHAPTAYDDKAVKKFLAKGGYDLLPTLAAHLNTISDWSAEAIDASLKAFAESHNIGLGKVAQPLRVALTGTSVSPGIGDTLALIGRDETLRRIDACLAARAT